MHFYPNERLALFIDGANLYATAKALGFDIDYKRLLALFRTKGQLVRALYYTALAEDQEYSSIRPLVDWLDYNGYTMVTKPTKEFTDALGRRKIKGNMDIELYRRCHAPGRASGSRRAVHGRRRLPRPGGCHADRADAGSASSRRCRPSRRWWPTSCAGRPTSSSISADLEDQICRDPATRPAPGTRVPSRRPAPAPAPATLDYPDDEEEDGRPEAAG